MATSFRKGQRVRYVGPVQSIKNQEGTVYSISRDGWIYVDFKQAFKVACAQVNLEPAPPAKASPAPIVATRQEQP